MTQKKKPSEAEKKAKEYIEHLQRLQAEFENYKKRTERERLQAAGRASTDLIMRLLPVADDLDRAIEAAGSDETAARFADGLILIRTHFLKVLADE
ncbi:MAG: nucleotide exchange factor GrpE, partial [Actinomycetota bacterium]